MNKTNYISPLTAYFLHNKASAYCSVTLDRITISGKFHAEQSYTALHANKWHQVEELDGRPTKFKLYRIDENGEIKGTIAVLVRSKFKSNTWRMDTSNHIRDANEKKQISNIISCFDTAHITRLDIAFDFINFDDAGMEYRLYKPNASSQTIRDRAGKIETIMSGGRKSRIQYRYYDKVKEQQAANIPKNINNWERLEIQLRDSKTKDWFNETQKMLTFFKRPNLTSIANKEAKTFFTLSGILKHPEYFNQDHISRRTIAKYRKMIKNNQGFDSLLADIAAKTLLEKKSDIEKEINSFFNPKMKQAS